MKTNKSKKIEIKPSKPRNGIKKYELYMDGQLVYKNGRFYEDTFFFDAGSNMTVKKDLNFDASLFLNKLFLHIYNPEGNWSKRIMLDIYREKDEITLSYFIDFDEDEVFAMNTNPIKLLKLFVDMAVKKGYINSYFMKDGLDVIGVELEITIPAQGNIYEYYKKHTKDLEKLIKKAGTQMGDKNQSLNRPQLIVSS